MLGAAVLWQKMNRLRLASYVCLAVGVIISVVGGRLGMTLYGGSCSAAFYPCHPSPPPEVVLGGYLLYLGAVAVVASLIALVFSFLRQPSVVV